MKSQFDNILVEKASNFLQAYLKSNRIEFLTADQAAEVLAKNNVLTNTVGPKPGFNFRQMLRDGRDGHIDLVTGAYQSRPKTKWFIYNRNSSVAAAAM